MTRLAARDMPSVACTLVGLLATTSLLSTTTLSTVMARGDSEIELGSWFIRRAGSVSQTGQEISSPAFNFEESQWLSARVPGTVLASLLEHGTFQNISEPYFERNLMFIPDISESGHDFWTYYYLTEFDAQDSNNQVWLNLRGINFEVEVWLNGVPLRPTFPEERREASIAGMFVRYQFDITEVVNTDATEKNRLVILARPPPYSGVPGGQGGGGDGDPLHEIGKNAASMQFSVGWDWIQATPDRNVGIWDKISITSHPGVLSMRHPHVITDGIVASDRASANLKFSTYVYNRGDEEITATVTFAVPEYGPDFSFDVTATFPAKAETFVKFAPQRAESPKLWMPIGYGQPNLYTLEASVSADGQAHDSTSFKFGFREFTTAVDAATKGRTFDVNGERVFMRGSNWITTDQLLRYATDAKRYDDEVRMHAEMRMNMIRVWGGGLTERPEFYEACDKYGILVMQDFWMTGDVNGRWAGDNDWPLDHTLQIDAMRDSVRMLRNHASLLFWCGGNEVGPDGETPPPDIEAFLHSFIGDPEHGDGTRLYLPSSMFDSPPEIALAEADGPYGIQNLRFFWETNERPAFNPEMGSIGMPNVESMRRTLNAESLADFPAEFSGDGDGGHPIGDAWFFHTWIRYNQGERDHIYDLGHPESIDEYAVRAQIVNYEQYRALFEGTMAHMYTAFTGMLVWKSHNPWSGLRGNLYDWLLDQTGAFYGLRKSLEDVHVQFDMLSRTADIVNIKHEEFRNMKITFNRYRFSGHMLDTWTEENITVVAHTLRKGARSIDWPNGIPQDETLLYRLILENEECQIVSQNDYWLSDPSLDTQTSRSLAGIRHVPSSFGSGTKAVSSKPVPIEHAAKIVQIGSDYVIQLSLKNSPSNPVAFFIRIQVQKAGFGDSLAQKQRLLSSQASPRKSSSFHHAKSALEEEEKSGKRHPAFRKGLLQAPEEPSVPPTDEFRVLPAWYSDNFVALVPGESRTLELSCAVSDADLRDPEVWISGWNVELERVL